MEVGGGWLKASAMGPAFLLKLSESTSENDKNRTNITTSSISMSVKVSNHDSFFAFFSILIKTDLPNRCISKLHV